MANPMLKGTDLPIEERGRLRVQADLRVVDGNGRVIPDAWGAGDVCAVPDLSGGGVGGYCVPNAQHAVRQGKLMAKNLVSTLRGEAPVDYYHKNQGAVAGIGLYTGVYQSGGAIAIKGFIAWLDAPRLPRALDADVGAQDPGHRELGAQLPVPPRHGRHRGPVRTRAPPSRSSPHGRRPEPSASG